MNPREGLTMTDREAFQFECPGHAFPAEDPTDDARCIYCGRTRRAIYEEPRHGRSFVNDRAELGEEAAVSMMLQNEGRALPWPMCCPKGATEPLAIHQVLGCSPAEPTER